MAGTYQGIQVQNMRVVPRAAWPHWTAFRPNTHEFVDPAGDRTIRLVGFERLEPGGKSTFMSASHVPDHANSYDVINVSLKLPLPGSRSDSIDPISGVIMLRPECLYCKDGAMPGPQLIEDHIQVNFYIHSDGPSGEPMIRLDQLAEMVAKLEREQSGRVLSDKGEYVAADGTVQELLETCWETRMGRKFPYPIPPYLDVPLVLPVTAYPWYPSRIGRGVHYKPFFSLGAGGPAIKLVKLEMGARLPGTEAGTHRFLAIMAGGLHYDGQQLDDLTALYAAPGHALGPFVAKEPSLLSIIQWRPKADRLAVFWED